MDINARIKLLDRLGSIIRSEDSWVNKISQSAYIENPWFTPKNCLLALEHIARAHLNEEAILKWIAPYNLNTIEPKNIGLVLAGNIPLVGWHDVMSTFISGHRSVIKFSSKDSILIKALIDRMAVLDARSASYFKVVERLDHIDAVIATGGNTAATYFKYYFGKYPHIIRKNRSSIAILDGQENETDLALLSDDIFTYFGLGCRSVSKLYVPDGYQFDTLFESSLEHAHIIDHNKYKNNFDYNNAIYLLSQRAFLTNNIFILLQDSALSSRIACVHYEHYSDIDLLSQGLAQQARDIQCITSKNDVAGLDVIPLGTCQRPELDQYADAIDTLHFLTNDL